MKSSLTHKREQIDSVDAKLLVLLNRRAKLVEQIRVIKSRHQLVTYDPKREQQILSRLTALNKGPLTEAEIKKLFKSLLVFFRQRQRSAKRGSQKRC